MATTWPGHRRGPPLHMIIAAEDATFGFPAARSMGALPNNMWLYNIGPQWAKRLTMTGDSITGAEAQRWGSS